MNVVKIIVVLFVATNPFFALTTQKFLSNQKTNQETNSAFRAGFLPILSASVEPTFPLRNYNFPDFQVEAKSALLYDVEANKIIFAKDIFERQPIASLTKLTTALVAFEEISPDKEIIISPEAVGALGEMGQLNVGEKISFQNLLYVLLLASSNDAAIAIAENCENLLTKMNQRAKELGLNNTFFEDPHGLSPNNQSNARELAKIMETVLKNSQLTKIMETSVIDFPTVNGSIKNRHLVNTNKLLESETGVFAGKTGYTEEAGECMITAARAKNGDTLISVVLNSPDRIGETKKLLNWAQEAFIWE